MSIFNGIRILDAASLVAAPLAASLLGDFGAEVVKVEDPAHGDTIRGLLPHKDGVGLLHKVTNRNKKSITLDLRSERGRQLFRRISGAFDVVIINYRPETVDRWGIDYEHLRGTREDLIMLHLTGFGRTGPYHDRPGFARIAEAFSGLTHITGDADRSPTLIGYPLVDSLAGIYGAWAITMALFDRQRTGKGQLIDLALYEPLLRILEDKPIEYALTGRVPARNGNANPYIAPNDLYRCGDGRYIVLPISSQSMFERLCQGIGRTDLLEDARFATNSERVKYRIELDRFITAFLEGHSAAEVVAILEKNRVSAGLVSSVAEVMSDPQVQARENIVWIWDSELNARVPMPAPVPRMSEARGSVHFAGRPKGADNDEVYCSLGISHQELGALRREGVI